MTDRPKNIPPEADIIDDSITEWMAEEDEQELFDALEYHEVDIYGND